MFIDYYALLEIDISASKSDIKKAYKHQALKWHPDRNIGIDTTKKMQEINEAYLILNDKDARILYNFEYVRYYEFKKNKTSDNQKSDSKSEDKFQKDVYEDEKYNISNEKLSRWIQNARRQSVDLAKQSIKDINGMIKVGYQAAMDAAWPYLLIIFILLILGLILQLFRYSNKTTSRDSYTKNIIDKLPPEKILTKADSVYPTVIKIDTTYTKFHIKEIGDINIPYNYFELQNKVYRDKVKKNISKNLNYKIITDNVIFQQKGLNFNNNTKTFIRVEIEKHIESKGSYYKLSQKLNMTKNEFLYLDSIYKNLTIESCINEGYKFLTWYNLELLSFNGIDAIKTSYLRQLKDNPPVMIQTLTFFNDDRIYLFRFSYRKEEEIKWKPIFDKIICSINIKIN